MSIQLIFDSAEADWKRVDPLWQVELATLQPYSVLSVAQWQGVCASGKELLDSSRSEAPSAARAMEMLTQGWIEMLMGLPHLEGQSPALKLGVWLSAEQKAEVLTEDLDRLATIWLHFPRFSDGRSYSNATVLRRLGYKGELLAFGDVLVDQVLLMQRCGFDVAMLRQDQSLVDALAALRSFSDFYQGDALQPLPAYRRGREVSTCGR